MYILRYKLVFTYYATFRASFYYHYYHYYCDLKFKALILVAMVQSKGDSVKIFS